jgi:hypothetical protein
MFIINLCSASVRFLHQLALVGSTANIPYSVNILASSQGNDLSMNISVMDADSLCNGRSIPSFVGHGHCVSTSSPPSPPVAVMPALSVDVTPALAIVVVPTLAPLVPMVA